MTQSEHEVHDVCLILEGTYPFVTGGVSSWVHNLIQGLPDISFTGLCILPSAKEARNFRYELPENFHDLRTIFIHDYQLQPNLQKNKEIIKKQVSAIREFHERMKINNYHDFERLSSFYSTEKNGMSAHDMIYGRDSWDIMVDFYNAYSPDASFIDYFWTYRVSHLPIYRILMSEIPRARLYHTVSTGYAGLAGVIAKHRLGGPLLLTEHGIYTKERRMEIAVARWIPEENDQSYRIRRELGTFRNFWLRVFQSLGSLAYQEADKITTIYEGNRLMQIADSADPTKIEVIPNGIDIAKFSNLKPLDVDDQRGVNDSFVIGFVGRVVQIKDVKTLIRACKIVSRHMPGIRVEILGPTDEDPRYYAECRNLVELLDMERIVVFTGRVDVREYYPHIDIVVLTSISEAQPLVILEANCAGIPAVASDVGACRDLLLGRTKADQELGPSGIVTRVAEPAETAQAVIQILSDFQLRRKMIEAGRKRVQTYYTQSDLNDKYRFIYQQMMGRNRETGSS